MQNKSNKYDIIIMGFVCTMLTAVILILLIYHNKTVARYQRDINNLQDEMLLLKEENKDVMDLNTQLMEELGYFDYTNTDGE